MTQQLIGGKFSATYPDSVTGALKPAVGYKLYTYISGTTTNKTTWTDGGLTAPNTNPVVLDARGEASVFIGTGAYTMKLTTATGSVIWTRDGIESAFAYTDTLRSDLAASSGAGLVGLIRSATGAIATTIAKWLGWQTPSVFDFMTDAQIADVQAGTLALDVTAAVQAAIDSLGSKRKLTFWGNMRISSALNFPNNGVIFEGENQWTSVITQFTSGAKIINNTGAFNEFRDLSLAYSASVPAAGSTALFSSGSNTRVSSVVVHNCDKGFDFTTGTAQMADNFQVFNYETIGIHFHSSNDLFISKFIINAGDTVRGRLGGIRLTDKAEAFIATDGDILLGVYSMTTDAGSYAANVRPAYNNFTNVFFDSSVSGVQINNMVETEFVGCWFSGGRSGGGVPGCNVNQSDSISFVSTRFFNCGGAGAQLNSGAARTTFDVCTFESNSVTAGAGVSHGLAVAANVSDFAVRNCIAHNGLYDGQQGYGILINAGTSDRYIISGNMLSGNLTGGLADITTGASAKVVDNIGYNPLGAEVVTYGASPFTHTNGHSPATFYIYGGTISDVSSGGQTLATTSPAVVHLGPNESVTITATVAPTMKKVTH